MSALLSGHLKPTTCWQSLYPSWLIGKSRVTWYGAKASTTDTVDAATSQNNRDFVIDMDTVNQQDSLILALPAELRIKIYEYCLIKKDNITVTKNLKQPALLTTCRRMRKEAAGIWYFSNSFYCEVVDCDAALLSAFCSHIRTYDEKFSKHTICHIDMSGKKWENLVEWCRYVWLSGDGMISYLDHLGNEHMVIYAAHEIALRAQSLSWKKCEGQLAALRTIAGRLDRGWLV